MCIRDSPPAPLARTPMVIFLSTGLTLVPLSVCMVQIFTDTVWCTLYWSHIGASECLYGTNIHRHCLIYTLHSSDSQTLRNCSLTVWCTLYWSDSGASECLYGTNIHRHCPIYTLLVWHWCLSVFVRYKYSQTLSYLHCTGLTLVPLSVCKVQIFTDTVLSTLYWSDIGASECLYGTNIHRHCPIYTLLVSYWC